MTSRLDRIAERLGTLPALLALAVLAAAPLALSFFAPSAGVPPWLALPFAGAFGVGGAYRDLGLSKPPPHRADHLQIAVLEYELLGIEPKPGTMAAFAVGLHRTGRQLAGEPIGIIDFPSGVRRSEIDDWCANYEHLAANTITVSNSDGSVELLYVDPSGRHRQAVKPDSAST